MLEIKLCVQKDDLPTLSISFIGFGDINLPLYQR